MFHKLISKLLLSREIKSVLAKVKHCWFEWEMAVTKCALLFFFFKYKKSFKFDQIWMECFISFKTFVFHFYFLACTFGSNDALPELKQQRRAALLPSPSLPLCLPRGWTQIFGPAHKGVQMWGCQPGSSFRPEVTRRCWRDSCPPCLSHHTGMLGRALPHTTPARAIPPPQCLGWGAVNPTCAGKVRPICCPHLNPRSAGPDADRLWHDTANRVSGQPDTAPHAHAKEELL